MSAVAPHRTMARTATRVAALTSFLLAAALAAGAQTFDLNQNNQQQTTQPKKGKKRQQQQTAPSQQSENPEGGIGWGSGIEVAREARAAQQALDRGDYQAAVTAANRAAHSAPGNTQLW